MSSIEIPDYIVLILHLKLGMGSMLLRKVMDFVYANLEYYQTDAKNAREVLRQRQLALQLSKETVDGAA